MGGANARYCLAEDDRVPVDRRTREDPEFILAPPAPAPVVEPAPRAPAIPVALALDVEAIQRWRGELNAAIEELTMTGQEPKRGILLTSLTRIEQLAGHGRKLLEPKRRT